SQLSPYATVVDENGNAVLTPTERLRVLQAQYVRDLASYSDDHPDIVRLRHEIDALSAQTGLPGLDRSMLQSTLAARVRELEAARERGWTDEHPAVIRLEAAVSNLREALASAPSGGSSNQPSAAPNNPIYL